MEQCRILRFTQFFCLTVAAGPELVYSCCKKVSTANVTDPKSSMCEALRLNRESSAVILDNDGCRRKLNSFCKLIPNNMLKYSKIKSA
uniref:Uncharacterized protein n=1 Tax=Cyprinus carpio TaxID=7962 RepID=A0A8C1ZED2_CYPCA